MGLVPEALLRAGFPNIQVTALEGRARRTQRIQEFLQLFHA